MWIEAVKKAGTTDSDAVIDAMIGITVPNLSGGYSAMMPNHHITKPVLIGEIQGIGQFDTVWQTPGLVVTTGVDQLELVRLVEPDGHRRRQRLPVPRRRRRESLPRRGRARKRTSGRRGRRSCRRGLPGPLRVRLRPALARAGRCPHAGR